MSNGTTYVRTSTSPEATKQLASTLVAHLQPGDAVVLSGDLGAGKTQFVQGIAAALGVAAAVQSPTFNLVSVYDEGELPLYHFDLYRLDHQDELEDIAFYEIVDGPGVSFIEWGEKFPNAMPYDYVEIEIRVNEEGLRQIKASSVGQRAQRLLMLWAKDSRSRLVKK